MSSPLPPSPTVDVPVSASPKPVNPSEAFDPTADAKKQAGIAFLASLLNRTLRVYTNDGRMFSGAFKCTDAERNVILSRAFEYRLKEARQEAERKRRKQEPKEGSSLTDSGLEESPTVAMADVTPRFMGLVVVPGQYITKIEVEEAMSF